MAVSKMADFSKAAGNHQQVCRAHYGTILTFRQIWLQNSLQIGWTRVSNGLELLGVHDLYAGAHIASIVSEVNLQALIAKDGLLISEDRICHFWVERVYGLDTCITGSNKGDMDGIIGVRGPCEVKSQLGIRRMRGWYAFPPAQVEQIKAET
jgi:hypothetical protein